MGSHPTSDDDTFREELRDWLADHLVGEFHAHRGVGGASTDDHWEIRVAWERELTAGGWLGITWPTEFGGRGGTLGQEAIFQVEHARAGGPYWAGVQGRDLLGPMLLACGTAEQKARFLPPIMRTEEFWAQGFSEPDAGSDLASVRTRAVRDGDTWVVDGQKTWTTYGQRADWLYVLCRTDPASKHHGLSMIIVPVDQPGVDIRPVRTLVGGAEFSEIFFQGARSTTDAVIGEVDGGWRVAMGTLGNERALAVLPFQIAFERELAELLAELRARGATGDPRTRQRLAQAWIGLQLVRYGNERLLAELARSGEIGAATSLGKLSWSRWHRAFGELATSLLGPDQLVVREELGAFQRIFLSSRAETIYGGADEIQRTIVGERLLGLPKEPPDPRSAATT